MLYVRYRPQLQHCLIGSRSSRSYGSIRTPRFASKFGLLMCSDASRSLRRSIASSRSKHPGKTFSSQTSFETLTKVRWRQSLLIAFGFMTSGTLGYFLATQTASSKQNRSGTHIVSLSTDNHEEHADHSFEYGSPEDFKAAIASLRKFFTEGDTLTTDPEDLHDHGFSLNDYHPGALHSVVVYPISTEDVQKIVKVANEYRMPIIPYSGGTSLEGHTRGHKTGGICVDLSRMDKILQINEADSDLICQPGCRWQDINSELKKRGIPLFFPLDPGPAATIGGMISTGCSGTNAVRYGTAKAEWFLNVTVVLPSGEVIKTRRRARKSSAGFDVTKLFIGAEGTLGIITEATLRLAPLLQTTVAVAQFPDVRHATEAVREVVNLGMGIQCVELVDDDFMHSTNLFGLSTRKYPVQDSLFFKFQGNSASSLADTAKSVKEIVEKHKGTGFTLARDDQEADALWADRKNALYSGLALVEGCKGWSTDVCVPVSNLPELVYETKKDLAASGLKSTIVGHAGDGNFHALLLFRTDAELEIAKGVVHRMVERAIALDGTCTGEHGVGIGKQSYLYDELGVGTVELMKRIKKVVDPKGLFNPGKLYPDKPPKSEFEH